MCVGQIVEMENTKIYEEVEIVEDDGGVVSFLTDADILQIIKEELWA